MKKVIETGHAKNVANLGKLIEFVDAYGGIYNPSRTALTISELKALETNAKNALDLVMAKLADYDDAVNHRSQAFADFKKRTTRVMNALKANGTTTELLEDAQGFNRKIQGQRASKPPVNDDPNATPLLSVSVSQQSFDLLVQHLKGLIAILKTEPNYQPNEDDLKLVNLDAYVTDLLDHNNKVAAAIAAISNARIDRDRVLYKESTGLVAITQAVKIYVKSVFGSTSSQFAQISKLLFSKKKS